MKNYDLMPPLHKHDSYLDCTKKYKDSAVYCVAKTYIKPDSNSTVWKLIKVRDFLGVKKVREGSAGKDHTDINGIDSAERQRTKAI